MARRVVETKAVSFKREPLQVLIVYEEGVSKQDIRKDSRLSKKHQVLYKSAAGYEYKN